jgi:microcystin-dependent protein
MLEMWFKFIDEGDLPVIGTVFAHCNTLTPDYALPCDGTQYLRVDYPELYASLDSVFIVDADNFVTPDLRGKTVLGTGLSASGTNYTINQSGGAEDHTLTTSEMPSHSHSNVPHSHTESAATPTAILIGAGAPAPSAIPGVSITGSSSISIDNTGGGQSHNNMQPFRSLRYAIWAR